MINEVKKALLIGVGGTALAAEKSVEQVEKLVDRGKLTVSEGKKLTEELIRQDHGNISDQEREQLEALLLEMNVAQRKDIEDLETRVNDLQQQLEKE